MLFPVPGSPAIAVNTSAASATLRHIGPAVSWLCAIGTMWVRETRPRVGFSPTRPHSEAGAVTEPSVSVPTAAAASVLSIAGTAGLLAFWHDAPAMSAIAASGGLDEAFFLPAFLIVPGIVLGGIGGLVGAGAKLLLRAI